MQTCNISAIFFLVGASSKVDSISLLLFLTANETAQAVGLQKMAS